jgi:hypothetical protein
MGSSSTDSSSGFSILTLCPTFEYHNSSDLFAFPNDLQLKLSHAAFVLASTEWPSACQLQQQQKQQHKNQTKYPPMI